MSQEELLSPEQTKERSIFIFNNKQDTLKDTGVFLYCTHRHTHTQVRLFLLYVLEKLSCNDMQVRHDTNSWRLIQRRCHDWSRL